MDAEFRARFSTTPVPVRSESAPAIEGSGATCGMSLACWGAARGDTRPRRSDGIGTEMKATTTSSEEAPRDTVGAK